MDKLELNKEYDEYFLATDINDSACDTYSFVGIGEGNIKIIIRVKNDVLIERGEIYHVVGKALEYKSKIHLYSDKIINIKEEELSGDEREGILNKLTSYINIDHSLCINFIEDTIKNIKNKDIKLITEEIYKDYKDKFIVYPAATKFHHPYRCGLLFHTYNALRIGLSLSNIYPNVSKDLVSAGLILHDMMKTKEINGFEGDYTLDGKLFGHITLIALEIEKYANKLNLSESMDIKMLKHILLTHHMEAEYGSPKKPQIIEALIVHLSDMCDAKIEPTIEALEKTEIGEYSEPVAVCDKTKFYKHGVK